MTHRFSLDQIDEAFATAAAESGGAIKVVVSPALDCAHGGTPAAASNVRPPADERALGARQEPGRTAARASHSAHYGAGLRWSGGLPREV